MHYIFVRVLHLLMVSRIDKNIGLFCKRALQKRRYSDFWHALHFRACITLIDELT